MIEKTLTHSKTHTLYSPTHSHIQTHTFHPPIVSCHFLILSMFSNWPMMCIANCLIASTAASSGHLSGWSSLVYFSSVWEKRKGGREGGEEEGREHQGRQKHTCTILLLYIMHLMVVWSTLTESRSGYLEILLTGRIKNCFSEIFGRLRSSRQPCE